MRSLAIIPARSNSKRIPGKNIKDFLGMPIIAYSIKAALESGIFDEIMVSTDDKEIAEVAEKYGAKVPFFRTKETANDYATTADVINEVLDSYEKRGEKFDVVCCLYATAPFVTPERLQQANSLILNDNFESVITCMEFSYPVLRSLVINNHNRISMKWPKYENFRSQDLEKFYHDAGQFYMSTVLSFRNIKSFWGENTAPIILSELEAQDMDTQTDWTLAEMKYCLFTNETQKF